MNNFLHVASGSGDIASTLAPGKHWELQEVRLHLNDLGGANDFTCTLDSGHGSAFDMVIFSVDLTSKKDYHYLPTRPLLFRASDKLTFAWTNSSGRTYGLEVVYSSI